MTVDGKFILLPTRFHIEKQLCKMVAKLALENILQKIKNEGCPLIHQDADCYLASESSPIVFSSPCCRIKWLLISPQQNCDLSLQSSVYKQDTVFCKSIFHEFAVKMNLEMPTYNTIQPQGLLPVFISSLVFNGVMYTGEAGINKKEAEQLAARAVILLILGNFGSRTILSEIIKSKGKLYAALHGAKSPCSHMTSFITQTHLTTLHFL
ncbi:hypothetical protein F2P56_008673 [Juglans regia]|uniref:DRBM domain-containing protein n=1 Tax=Juglans regia TaxID=51240 RepID=A0A834CYU3_JUGRE|nr:hypothetical protein F2P56_008673 [Juglans regia]